MSNLRRLRGLRAQLLLWTILPLTVALVVLSLAGVFRHREDMLQLVEQRDRSLAAAEATSVAHQVERRAVPLQGAAGQPSLQGDPAGLPVALDQLFQQLALMYPAGLAVYGTDGSLLAASPPGSASGGQGAGWPQSDAARALARRADQAQYGMFQGADGTPGSQLVLMAASAGKERVLLGALPIDALRLADVGAHLRTETQGAVFILDGSGQPLLSDTAGLNLDPATLAGAIGAGGKSAGSLLLTAGGQQLLLAHGRIDPPGWTLVTAENIGALQVTSINELEILPLLLLFVAVLALLAVSFGVANVVRPLQELDRRAAGVAWGDFDGLERPVGGVQEIDDLRRTLAQMAERIRAYQTGMRDYLSAVTLAQEEERRRLAHELHDDTVQALIALKQRTQMAQKAVSNLGLIEGLDEGAGASGNAESSPAWPASMGQVSDIGDAPQAPAVQPNGKSAGSPSGSQPSTREPGAVTTELTPSVRTAIAGNAARAGARLDELEQLIDQELVALRRLIGDLRPIYLEDLGFVPALEMLAGQVRQEHGLATGVEVHGEAVRLAPDLELAAYRIVQQAVRNVLAHAAAQSVHIDISFDTDGITLVVGDDGRGFTPPEQPADLTRGGHFGLMGMRERAMLYGGRLNIASAPGQGATVTAWLPIC